MEKKLLERLKNWATYFKHNLVGEEEWKREDEPAYQQIKKMIQEHAKLKEYEGMYKNLCK